MRKELYLNCELVDIDISLKIAVTKQINNIAELATRQSDYSNQFKIPATARNKRILGYPNLVQSASSIPKTNIPATYLIDGVAIVFNGFAVIEEVDENFIHIIIYAGNLDFFKEIDGKSIRELEYDQITWGLYEIEQSSIGANIGTKGHVYPILDWSSGHNSGLEVNSKTVSIDSMLPAVYVKDIINKIFASVGYTKVGNIFNDENYLNAIVPCVDFLLSDESKEKIKAKAHITSPINADSGTYSPGAGGYVVTPLYDSFEDDFSIFSDELVGGVLITKFFGFKPALYDMKLTANVTSTGGGVVQIRTFNTMALLTSASFASGTVDIDISTFETALDSGDSIIVQFIFFTASPTPNPGSINTATFECTNHDIERSIRSREFDIAPNLPAINQREFLKQISFMFGLMFAVDNTKKEVNVIQFSELFGNKHNSIDWSDKIDITELPTITLHERTYAQVNKFVYEKTDDVEDGYGDGQFAINDKTLDDQLDLVELEFSASMDVAWLDGVTKTCRVPIFEDYIRAGDITPRILIAKTVALTDIVFADDGFSNTYIPKTDDFVVAEFKPTLAFAGADGLLENYYNDMMTMFANYKKVTLLMNLSIVDIAKVDHFKPVFLKEFGSYFYINLIQDYTGEGSTKVELVRI